MPEATDSNSPLRAALAVNALGFSSYYLLLPVVPLAASRYGGTVVSGSSTAAFMAATVVTQFLVPQLTKRVSARTLLGLSGVALGAPTLAYLSRSGALL